MLQQANEIILTVAALIAFFVAAEIGYRLGLRFRARGEGAQEHIKSLTEAMLGLLALLLGFNFVMASSRFEDRKALIQEEAQAIGNVWLRTHLLQPPQRQEIAKLLKSYLSSRVDYMNTGADPALIESAMAEASDIEAQIWRITSTMLAEGSRDSQIELWVESLSEMAKVKSSRRAALDNHVPEPVLYLLFTVALGSLGFIGYGYGLRGSRRHVSTAIVALLIVLVFGTILDFDRPRGGFIRIGEEGLLRLQVEVQQQTP